MHLQNNHFPAHLTKCCLLQMGENDRLNLPRLSGRYRWQRTVSGAWLFIDNRRGGGKRENIGHFTTATIECALGRATTEGEGQSQKLRARTEVLRQLLERIGEQCL
jgi:hypothetical protein